MHVALRCLLTGLLVALFYPTVGCEKQPGESGTGSGNAQQPPAVDGEEWVPEEMGEYPIGEYDNYTETGDLDAIKKHGKLRILVDMSNTDSLHRSATQQDIELEQARRLAQRLKLEPVVLYVECFDELIPQLNAGKGDIIANNLAVTEERKQLVDFSTPMTTSKLVLVSRQNVPAVGEGDLKGKTLVVTDGTTSETQAEEFARQHPGVKLKVLDRNYVDLAVDVAQGKVDFTIIDEYILDQVLQFRDGLKKNHTFPETREIAWAIRKNSPQLLEAINDKVRHIKLTRSTERFTGDLDKIK